MAFNETGNETGWNSVIMDYEGHNLRLSLTIRNFMDYFCKPGKVLQSPQMECTQRCGAKWTLRIYAYGENEEEKDKLAVYLKLDSQPPHAEIIRVTFRICLVGKGGRKIKIGLPCDRVEDDLKSSYGYSNLIMRSEIESKKDLYLPNGHLTIRCEGKAFLDKPNTKMSIVENPPSAILTKIYVEKMCSDVVLKTNKSTYQCHKNILAAASNYFKAIFQQDTKGNMDNVVDLSNDLTETALKAMLDFIYLGKRDLATLSCASLQTLFGVSDKYEIGNLADVCETELIRQVNPDNALELLIFSDQLGANRLKKRAASVIADSSD